MRLTHPTGRTIAFAAIALLSVAGAASAQAPPNGTEIPASIEMGHAGAVSQLEALSGHSGRVGSIARQTLTAVKRHIAREDEYIKPPLALLPYLADGRLVRFGEVSVPTERRAWLVWREDNPKLRLIRNFSWWLRGELGLADGHRSGTAA